MAMDKTPIAAALAAATCALLGSSLPEPVQAQEEPKWEFNTALLYYGEDNDRVQDLSLNLLAQRNFVDDRFLTMGLTIDALTGASPNGALPQSVAQTFTQPSGRRTYTTEPGEIPIDDTFRDTRVAVNASWQQPLGRLYQFSAGVSASGEYDYVHTGVNARLSRDFNQRNTTVSAGIALAQDTLDPVGRVPDGLTAMRLADGGDDDDDGGGGGGASAAGRSIEETKDVFDFVFGVTQIVSRNFLFQVNYSFSESSGYLNDPYKVLSVVDGVTGDPVPLAPDPVFDGPSHLFLYEHRPDERTKHSLYTQGKYYMSGKVLDLSYRYMTDDWEIDSHTLEARYRMPIGEGGYLEPHLRYYTQSEAEFYAPSIVNGAPLPEYASADYRLGNFDAVTVGLKYGRETSSGNDFNVRLELYQQSGDIPSSQLIGNQTGRDNYPDLDAVILQFGYRFDL